MKTTLGVILGVILGAVIVIGVSVWLIFSVFSPGNQKSPSTVAAITPKPGVTSTVPSASTPSAIIPTITMPSPVANLPPAQSSAQSNVNFDLKITNFAVSSMNSGTVDAQITNTGTGDAHNVWVKVEVISQGSIVKVGGQDYLRKDLGIVKAGQSLTSQVVINVSLADGMKIAQSGATFRLTVYSDEKTQTLNYDFHP
jgi:hypothetical protein